MEIPQMPFLVLILSLFIFTFSVLKHCITKHKKSYINLPPGPHKLPFIGNILNLVGSVPHRALRNLASKYGEVRHMQIGELSVIVISSPEAAKSVMKTHDANFSSRPSILAAEVSGYGCTGIAFAPYGDYWRQLRKICSVELLSAKRVESFRWIREQVYQDLTTWIAASKEGLPFNLTEKLYSAAYAVVSIAAVGKKTEEQESLVSVLKESVGLGSGFSIGDLYPSSKLLRRITGLGPNIKRLHLKADGILERIICEHEVAKKADHEGENQEEDLLDVLLKFQDEKHEIPLTADNIKAVINEVLSAGSETSVTTMDWAMAEMLKNPEVLKRAQDEVRLMFDAKGYVDESFIHELKYLKCVVKETLRLHPPAPLLLPRKCMQKCEISGFEIPAGTKIIVNAWAINRDPKYWTQGECFKPERFIDSEVDYKGKDFEYIPFGAGRRMCPGISFGIINVELPLAMFLYHFDWKLPAGMRREEMDMSDAFGITARRKHDLWIVPILKRPLPAPAN